MRNKGIIFMVILLCTVLCSACAAEKPIDVPKTDSEVVGTADESQTKDEDSVTVEIHIIVNPEIKLFVNGAGTVQNIQCLNEDGEKVCEGLKLEGESYENAFSLLVEKIHAEGYMEGREVTIQITIPGELGAEVPQWEQNVEKAWISALEKQSVSCSFMIQLEVQENLEEESHQESIQDQPIDDERFEKVERDSSGNIIMTVEKDQDGNTITCYYDNTTNTKEVLVEFVTGGSERYFYSADGSMERKIFTDEQGVTIEHLFVENMLVQEIVNGGDEQRFYEDGVLRREIQKTEAYQSEHTYNAQGILEKFVEIGQTATTIEVYHPDGWLELRRIEYEDHFRENIYQADGVLLSEENSELGIKYVYDMAGNKIEAYDVDNYGRRTHIFWLSDGTAVIYVHEFDGTVTKSVQEANNGSVISEIRNYTGPETADIGAIVPPVAKNSN